MDGTNVCYWEYHEAQFAGGPFMYTSCEEAYSVGDPIPERCPSCGKPVVEREREDGGNA